MDYFFATNKGGKSLRPLVAGAATFNEQKQTLDLHVVNFRYRKSYMKNVLADGKGDKMEFELALGAR